MDQGPCNTRQGEMLKSASTVDNTNYNINNDLGQNINQVMLDAILNHASKMVFNIGCTHSRRTRELSGRTPDSLCVDIVDDFIEQVEKEGLIVECAF